MKCLLSSVFLLSFIVTSFGQDFVSVTNAANYNEQAFYRLNDDHTTNITNDSWDIAFTTMGLQDAGVHINEANRGGFASPQAEIEVYLAPATTWEEAINIDSLTNRLYNNEADWLYGGAFNNPRNPSDFFDFGWGKYSPATNQVSGSKIYVIKLRNGSWKKFQIQSVVIKTYTFRYANLDGSNEVTKTLNKDDFAGAPFALFSFNSGNFLNNVQRQWDMLFSRYVTVIYDFNGNPNNYSVVGVLTAPGVQVAEARGVDPATVEYQDYKDSLKRSADIIGHDWKTFTNVWSVPQDLVYFVKTLDNKVWQVQFILYGGASSGETVFTKSEVDLQTNIGEVNDERLAITAFPNPASTSATVVFESDRSVPSAQIHLTGIDGKIIRHWPCSIQQGLNALVLEDLPAAGGIYIVRVNDGQTVRNTRLVIR